MWFFDRFVFVMVRVVDRYSGVTVCSEVVLGAALPLVVTTQCVSLAL